jgi:hypothetical protein
MTHDISLVLALFAMSTKFCAIHRQIGLLNNEENGQDKTQEDEKPTDLMTY